VLPLLLTLALAAPSVDDDAQFQKGLALYEDLEFEQAILLLQEVAVRDDLAPADKARVLVWLGVAHGQTGNLDAAKRHFELAAAAHTDVELPVRVGPRLDRMFHDARREAREAAKNAPPEEPEPPEEEERPPYALPHDPEPLPEAEPEGGGGLWWITAGVGGGLGAVSVAAAGALGVYAAMADATFSDPQTPQPDAVAARDTGVPALIGAVTAGVVGVGLLGLGGVATFLALGE
jgi:hypothetical protein